MILIMSGFIRTRNMRSTAGDKEVIFGEEKVVTKCGAAFVRCAVFTA